MSNLRDIQKLRQTRNLDVVSFGNRNTQYRPVETYNINLDRLNEHHQKNNANMMSQSNKYSSSLK